MKLLFIFLFTFINYNNCSLLNFFQPHNYILSNNWRLSQDRPINIGWSNEDHNSTIHSITTSYDNQYIISCSNDKLVKFHRVLMYPNLYPDWTHLYYGNLKIRGFNDSSIENLKCISTLDGNQLLVLSKNNNNQLIYIDVYQKFEMDSIENRVPIIFQPGKERYKGINQLKGLTKFETIFPLDDYNEIWIDSLGTDSIKKYQSIENYQKLVNDINNSSKSFKSQNFTITSKSPIIFELSPNSKSLLLSYDNKIIIQNIGTNNNKNHHHHYENIEINKNYIVKDIKFIPSDYTRSTTAKKLNSFLLLAYDNSSSKKNNETMLQSIKKNKLILYSYDDQNNNGGEWKSKELELPYILSNSIKMTINRERGTDYDCLENNQETYDQPILIGFQDLDFTIHLTQLKKSDLKLTIIKSLPLPFESSSSSSTNINYQDKSNLLASIGFSKDSTLVSIQYPISNIIYIYKKDSIINGLYDFKLSTIIDELPNRINGSVLLFNLKYNYLVTNFKGHLSFFRDLVDSISQCDKSSRTQSFYLQPPPLLEGYNSIKSINNSETVNNNNNNNNENSSISLKYNSLILEHYGLLYLLKNDEISLNFIKIKFIAYTILAYSLVYILQRAISQFETLFIIPKFERLFKRFVKSITLKQFLSNHLFYTLCVFIFVFSNYEIVNEPAFTNDWPAHIHHIRQFLNPPPSTSSDTSIFKDHKFSNSNHYKFNQQHHSIGYYNNNTMGNSLLPESLKQQYDFDYSHYMHYHGPNTYPAGFTYLYTLLYNFTNNGDTLQYFQFVWAILEICNFILIKKICEKLKLPILLSILPIISNRLHLYNVRVVINDFPSTILIHLSILLLLSKRFKLFSTLYSVTVSLKLHTIFYSPAILFIFFNNLSIGEIILNLFIMASIQLLLGLPFLLVNPIGYIMNAYDFSRTLLWEKTRNFKFVGRILYDLKLFNLLLLIILIFNILLFIYKFQKIINYLKKLENIKIIKKLKMNDIKNFKYYDQKGMELVINRIYVLAFLSINFIAIVWARGLYTPFMCWYFYTLPIILYFSDFSYTFIILYWAAHEILFRGFKDLYIELFATYLFFNINLSIIIRLFIKFRPHDKNNIKLFNLTNTDNNNQDELSKNKKEN